MVGRVSPKSHPICLCLQLTRYFSRFAAQNGSALARAGITHILTMTTDSIAYPKNQQLEIKRVDIEDYPDEVRSPLIYLHICLLRAGHDRTNFEHEFLHCDSP